MITNLWSFLQSSNIAASSHPGLAEDQDSCNKNIKSVGIVQLKFINTTNVIYESYQHHPHPETEEINLLHTSK